MNQKGFGLKEFIIIISITFICILIITSLYKSIVPTADITNEKTKETVSYKDLENKLEKAAERYQNDTYSANASDKNIWELSYDFLKEKKYIDTLIDPKTDKECTGYVEFIQDGAIISYKPFLKCETSYQTKGYNSENNMKTSY